ncbi:MAG: Unknown protein [uncultured Sulfurovum sp.]|uniref:Uncharacterized protein n=1 Tax=uncultured Sulfurovum sp. TaxID=269237 RepID=A0A6S6TUW6_9BACT|nr:MAG: Unknown protein [uncultured Sulfurovum sp.]
MKRKLLTTTLLSMSLLSFNVSAGSKMKCTGTNCFVDLSGLSPAKQEVVSTKKSSSQESYSTVILDDIETIIFTKYVMSNDEVAEYDLENILHNRSLPTLNEENLPNSDYFCEDNLKPVMVENMANTYECA